MEKIMSVEDKIKRAEEIYYRRKNQEIPVKEETKKSVKPKWNIKLFKKLIKQIIMSSVIYIVFYGVINKNYVFSEDFTNKLKNILEQNIDFSQIYIIISNVINQEKEKIEKDEIQNNDENIGGAEELPIVEEVPLSQMEQDANYIKNTIDFKKPVDGKISSMFGLRNPTTATVSKNHTGTDIAAATGTKIISATNGKVIYKSSKGNYGKHIKIQTNDVIVLYAHCDKIYVKEGDIINQGQEIGEVGSTGNTTGPHLHFEIRYQDRYVDPQLILEL